MSWWLKGNGYIPIQNTSLQHVHFDKVYESDFWIHSHAQPSQVIRDDF